MFIKWRATLICMHSFVYKPFSKDKRHIHYGYTPLQNETDWHIHRCTYTTIQYRTEEKQQQQQQQQQQLIFLNLSGF